MTGLPLESANKYRMQVCYLSTHNQLGSFHHPAQVHFVQTEADTLSIGSVEVLDRLKGGSSFPQSPEKERVFVT